MTRHDGSRNKGKYDTQRKGCQGVNGTFAFWFPVAASGHRCYFMCKVKKCQIVPFRRHTQSIKIWRKIPWRRAGSSKRSIPSQKQEPLLLALQYIPYAALLHGRMVQPRQNQLACELKALQPRQRVFCVGNGGMAAYLRIDDAILAASVGPCFEDSKHTQKKTDLIDPAESGHQ